MENKKIVYFDTNIFIKLRKQKDIKELDSFNKILKLKEQFYYVYSEAHIFDFQNDSKGEYIKDFEVMEEIVDNNYIYFDINKNQFVLINRNATECFNDTIKFNSIYERLDFNNFADSILNFFSKNN